MSRAKFARAGLANHGLTVPLQVADTEDSVRQGTTGPRQGNKSHLLRFRQRALNLLSACISGSQALMKGDRLDHIEASCSSLPGVSAQATKEPRARHYSTYSTRHPP